MACRDTSFSFFTVTPCHCVDILHHTHPAPSGWLFGLLSVFAVTGSVAILWVHASIIFFSFYSPPEAYGRSQARG